MDVKKNPYNFVEFDYSKEAKRTGPVTYEKFSNLSGKIFINITSLTPIFVGGSHRVNNSINFFTVNSKYAIPGTSIKGILRTVAEAVSNSCMSVFDKKYKINRQNKIVYNAKRYSPCTDVNNLCISCRIFGMQSEKSTYLGKIGLSDFICSNPVSHQEVYLSILDKPKPRHKIFYGHPSNRNLARGRKFYFHFNKIVSVSGFNISKRGQTLNNKIKPLDKNSIFNGIITFENFTEDELSLLLYSILLENNMAHKIGMAKPLGFGSAKMKITKIETYDFVKKYTGDTDKWKNVYEESGLSEFITKKIDKYVKSREKNIEQLRKLLKFDPNDTTAYKYPDFNWFKNNSTTELPSI